MQPVTTPFIPLLDEETIAESKELMQEKYEKLMNYFLEDSALYVTQIEQAFTHAETEAMVAPSHTLKSSSAQMGASRLSSIAAFIERHARDAIQTNQPLTIPATTIAELKTTLEATIAACR